ILLLDSPVLGLRGDRQRSIHSSSPRVASRIETGLLLFKVLYQAPDWGPDRLRESAPGVPISYKSEVVKIRGIYWNVLELSSLIAFPKSSGLLGLAHDLANKSCGVHRIVVVQRSPKPLA